MMNKYIAIGALVFCLQSCSPAMSQQLAEAVSDARRAYTCVEIADECRRQAEAAGDNPAILVDVMRSCFGRFEHAGCKDTLDDLAKYLPEVDAGQ
ncbi:MAG: hypothetical protein GY854_19785 [Deltaproteobacteria bacterium]|nr:hypothetical protein [Deltaproteobacteria bacterium]